MKKLKNIIKTALLTFGCIGFIGGFASPVVSAASVDVLKESCKGAAAAKSPLCDDPKGEKLFGPDSLWTKVVNMLIFLVGAVAIIMIVVGGLRYSLSNGDQNGINTAKNTILYAVVGLVIAASAFTIVNFVLTRI